MIEKIIIQQIIRKTCFLYYINHTINNKMYNHYILLYKFILLNITYDIFNMPTYYILLISLLISLFSIYIYCYFCISDLS